MIPGKPEGPKWAGRDIFHPNDGNALHITAADYEFRDGLPQAEAEEKAYQEYIRGRQVEAAVHHLRGLKAAIAMGDKNVAMKHSALYTAHVQSLGGEPVGAIHPEVQAHMTEKPGKMKFVAHKADTLIKPELVKSEAYANEITKIFGKIEQGFNRLYKVK